MESNEIFFSKLTQQRPNSMFMLGFTKCGLYLNVEGTVVRIMELRIDADRKSNDPEHYQEDTDGAMKKIVEAADDTGTKLCLSAIEVNELKNGALVDWAKTYGFEEEADGLMRLPV